MMKYSFKINYRVVPGSKREEMLLEMAQEYGLEPGCRLIDRMLQDRALISQDRASRMADALRKKQEADQTLNQLAAGGK